MNLATNARNAEFSQRLSAACRQMGLSLDEAQSDKLLQYIEQMQQWNRAYNLTALRDAEQMLVQHVFDSLSVVRPLQAALQTELAAQRQARILDVGSGGGLPGVVLAIAEPAWQITCVDAVEKKMTFVRQMSGVLALPNLQARHARVESMEAGSYDVVISRAFASLADFVAVGGPQARAQGRLAAMKGKTPDDEIAALCARSDWRIERINTLSVPELDAQRCLVWMQHGNNHLEPL